MSFSVSVSKKINNLPPIQNILSLLLLVGDILGLLLSLSLSLWWQIGESVNPFEPLVYLLLFLVLAGLYLADTYHPDTQIAGLRAPSRILIANFVVGGIIAALIYCSALSGTDLLLKRGTLFSTLGLFTIWAISTRIWATKWARGQAQQRRWLVLGGDKATVLFSKIFLKYSSLGRLIVLTTAEQKTSDLPDSNRLSVGSLKELPEWSQQGWSGVIVGTPNRLSDEQMQHLIHLRLSGVSIYSVPDICEILWYKIPSHLLQDNSLAFGTGFHVSPDSISQRLKRFFDIISASLLLIFLFPLMLVVALAIKLDSPGKIFYSQIRTGLEGKPFKVYKFRSMYEDAEKRGAQWACKLDPRITKVGRFLRLTRIDELPQIFNVIVGEMSLIGPRPERPEFDIQLRKEIPYYDLRYVVKPGITGWAQVMYPYGASVEDACEKLAYDLYYIKNYSFALDLAIFLKTIRVVLLGKGR